jgi:hypothetical protein
MRAAGSARVITTAPGTRAEAFGPVGWGLVAAIAGLWGSSFLLLAIGLKAFRPGLVTLLHIAVGATALSLFPRGLAARRAGGLPTDGAARAASRSP